ncbi:MAG: rRNA adenine N-6-methyltransferase family protein [bacterium]
MFSTILAIFTLFISVLILIWTCVQIYINYSSDKIGFVPSSSPKLSQAMYKIVHEYIKKQEKYTFVELGSGISNNTITAAKRFRFKRFIAVELDPFLVVFSKFFAFLNKVNIEFYVADLYKFQIPKDSIIYCYLGNTIVTKLYKQGSFKGQLVISTTFKINDVKETQSHYIGGIYRKIFVYDFRGEK